MSINNREDANRYYQQINLLVVDYIDKWKIRPKNLKSYLRPGSDRFNRFLKRNNLENVSGANVVLNDIINDRVSMESDGVVTFESFNYFESVDFKMSSLRECLYKGVEKSTLSQEKILADYFDLNLGDIEVVDSDKHTFKISDWENDDWNVVIYSKEEVDLIKTNILSFLYGEFSDKEIEILPNIKINLKNIVPEDKFNDKLEEILSVAKLKEIIADCLGEDWAFESEKSDHFIWVC